MTHCYAIDGADARIGRHRPFLKFSMTVRLPSVKAFSLAIAGILVISLLFSWLVLPQILQAQAEKYLAAKSGHHLTMNRPQFNPFELSLRLSGLRLTEPDGEPLLAFRELVVDLSAASLYRGAPVFDSIRLDGLEATAVLLAGGRLNWSALIAALQRSEPGTDSTLPGFDIHRFMLSGARLDFTDRRMTPAFNARAEPVSLELTDLSSMPGDNGKFKFIARTSFGASLAWQGDARLEPLAVTGSFDIGDVNITAVSAYFKGLLPVTPSSGVAGLSGNYRLGYAQGKLDLNLEHVAAKLAGLEFEPGIAVDAIEARDGSFDLAKNQVALGSLSMTGGRLALPGAPQALGSLAIEEVNVNLNTHHATVGRIALAEGHLRVARDAQGKIDLLEAFKSGPFAGKPETVNPTTAKLNTANSNKPAVWHYRLKKLELAGFDAAFRDETVTPAAKLAVTEMALSLDGISDDLKVAVPLKASFTVPGGGRFAAEGRVIPSVPTADLQLALTDLDLKPVQPYLSKSARLKLVSGLLSTTGQASYDAQGASYRGSFALNDLLLNEADTGNLFLSWRSLGSRSFAVTPSKLDIGELTVSGLDTSLIINKDKSVSFKRLLVPSAAPVRPQPAAHAFQVDIDRLRVKQGEMDFADYSLAMPFGARIHNLNGVIAGLSTRPDAQGQLELDGLVDEYGTARAAGKIDLMNPTGFTDIKVVFRNIEMSRLTPYSATFAGRKITSGKLSLGLEYKVKQRQLQGTNQVIMDQLTLGERVESAQALDLPLDLAIGILQDADGRIELGLPVSGSLDDPSFSYGGIVWKAIANVLASIATAPFRALGALFGGDEKFENIAFDAGRAQLTPPEREKLVRLAQALGKRPALFISVHGVYADEDRAALQDWQLRRTVAKMTGHADEDPGPVAIHQPGTQAALETLFADRLGGAELAAVRQGFRRANPGQLEEGAAGKVISGLAGLFREKRTLTEQEVASLKGVDFYAVLFERLRNKVVVDDRQLLALASARADATAAALKEAGAPAERVEVLAAEKTEAVGRDVPVRLVLGVAK